MANEKAKKLLSLIKEIGERQKNKQPAGNLYAQAASSLLEINPGLQINPKLLQT